MRFFLQNLQVHTIPGWNLHNSPSNPHLGTARGGYPNGHLSVFSRTNSCKPLGTSYTETSHQGCFLLAISCTEMLLLGAKSCLPLTHCHSLILETGNEEQKQCGIHWLCWNWAQTENHHRNSNFLVMKKHQGGTNTSVWIKCPILTSAFVDEEDKSNSLQAYRKNSPLSQSKKQEPKTLHSKWQTIDEFITSGLDLESPLS